MQEFLDVLRKFVDNVGGDKYSLSSVPSSDLPLKAEAELTSSWGTYEELSDADRSTLRENLTLSLSAPLLAYAVRTATLAVRRQDKRLPYYGVLALTVDDHFLDERDVACVCSVLHDACVRVGVDPVEVFSETTKYSAGRRLKHLEFYYRESPDYMKDLSAMGFEAAGEGSDFSYRDSLA